MNMDTNSPDSESPSTGASKKCKRRQLLKAAGGGAAIGIPAIAGCLGRGGSGGGEDSLVVQITGGNYIESYKSEVFNKFEEEYDITIKTSIVSDQFDGYSKVKTGQSDADLTITSASTLYNGSKEDVWADIDPAEVENYSNLLDTFKNPIYDPGEAVHAIPTVYGTVGLAYNKDEVGEPDSWAAAWDSANEGDIALEGFGFVRVFTTALYLGMDPNNIQVDGSYDQGIQKIWDSVRDQKELVVKYWTTGDEHVRLFTQGTATVGEAWGGRIYGAVNDGNDQLGYTVPKEGAYGWSDNWAMVKGLSEEKKESAYKFFNFLLREDTMKNLTSELGYPPATTATSSTIEGLYDYDPSGGERLTFLNPGYKEEHNDQWSSTWEEIQKG